MRIGEGWKLVRELIAEQACVLAFTVYDKVHIVTIITSDVSGVTMGIPNLYTRLWLTLIEL